MPKHPARDPLPGNDGRWFLELVGVVEPSLESTDSYATLEGLVPPPMPDDTATISAGAGAAAVNGGLADEAAHNGGFVTLGDGAVQQGTVEARRWWPWLVAAMIAGVMVAAAGSGAYLLPRSVNEEAAQLASRYRATLTNLRNELPVTQAAVAALTDPATLDDDMSAVPAAIAQLNTVSGLTTSRATTPLPETLPLVPRARFEALEPTRSTMTILGASGRDLAGRLGVGYTYRTAMDSLFAVNVLPTSAAPVEITGLSLALATDLADTGRLVSELPPDGGFVEVRDAALAASQRYATWQLEYLEALRAEDRARASELIAERGAAVAALDLILRDALVLMRLELDPLIVELAAELEAAIVVIPG